MSGIRTMGEWQPILNSTARELQSKVLKFIFSTHYSYKTLLNRQIAQQNDDDRYHRLHLGHCSDVYVCLLCFTLVVKILLHTEKEEESKCQAHPSQKTKQTVINFTCSRMCASETLPTSATSRLMVKDCPDFISSVTFTYTLHLHAYTIHLYTHYYASCAFSIHQVLLTVFTIALIDITR